MKRPIYAFEYTKQQDMLPGVRLETYREHLEHFRSTLEADKEVRTLPFHTRRYWAWRTAAGAPDCKEARDQFLVWTAVKEEQENGYETANPTPHEQERSDL